MKKSILAKKLWALEEDYVNTPVIKESCVLAYFGDIETKLT